MATARLLALLELDPERSEDRRRGPASVRQTIGGQQQADPIRDGDSSLAGCAVANRTLLEGIDALHRRNTSP